MSLPLLAAALAALLAVRCKPTAQPLELSDSQAGFSTQNDQRKYLDIGDLAHKLRPANISQVWRSPHAQQHELTSSSSTGARPLAELSESIVSKPAADLPQRGGNK